ncbi:MAG: hypothetical protein DWB48_10315 [Nitrosomonas sp.]|nr:hypothetical protein [Nitrosomonas sp.]
MRKTYLLLLLLLGCGKNPFAPRSEIGPIIFVSNRDGIRQIYAMNEDGSNKTRITYSNFHNYRPRWSRDGKHIIFNSRRSANIHYEAIVMAEANGSNEKVLLEHGVQPLFSPTGDKIAFSYDTLLPGFGSNYDIALHDLPTGATWLFKEDTSFSETVTDWSPDAQYLLVENWKGTSSSRPSRLVINIDLINLLDSSRTQLTESPPQLNYFGRFSPDGQSIVYVHKDSSGTRVRNVYIMNRDGSGKRNVTSSDTLSAISPVWSPDGSKIIFMNWDAEYTGGSPLYNIYSINIDGTGMIQLTEESDQVAGSGLDWRW